MSTWGNSFGNSFGNAWGAILNVPPYVPFSNAPSGGGGGRSLPNKIRFANEVKHPAWEQASMVRGALKSRLDERAAQFAGQRRQETAKIQQLRSRIPTPLAKFMTMQVPQRGPRGPYDAALHMLGS